ncbi:Putative small GTP-binding protein [Septoria linicola]|uniref:Small GTP-binding protein n=1 Tax=Septoria linicola TaxID=215465 RepID=A0A9Q9AQN9_9PEZI|nr:putative small GTP-binding protein [Septoria linicola]USW49046.1 Putative small GTP-binding protein [Septoria linicola]
MVRQRRGTASSANTSNTDIPSSSHGPQELGSMYDYLAKIILLGPSNSGKSCLLHRFVKSEWRILSSQTIGVEFASKIVKVGDMGAVNGTYRGRDAAPRRKRIKLQLWDTAGTERFRSVSRSYYRGAAGAILVYDVSNPDSFRGLGEFLRDARTLGSPQLSVVLVGNKKDLKEDPELAREVQQESLLDGDAFGSLSSRTGTIGPGNMPTGLGSQQRATVASDNDRGVSTNISANWASQNRIPAAMEVSALSGDGVEEAFNKLARIILTKIELGEIDPDDPMSGIQYGDADYYRFDDGSSSIKSGGLTSDGYGGSTRRRRRKGGVLGLAGGGGRCC